MKAFLFDNNRRIVTSSLDDHQSFSQTDIPRDYNLTSEDVANGCQRTTRDSDGQITIKLCQFTAFTLGDETLKTMAESHPDTLFHSNSNGFDPVLMNIGDEKYFVSVASLTGLGTQEENNMNWRLVVLLKESDVTKSIVRGRNVSIGVTIIIVFFIAALVAVGLHVVFMPLAVVARMMSESDFLEADYTSSSSSGEELGIGNDEFAENKEAECRSRDSARKTKTTKGLPLPNCKEKRRRDLRQDFSRRVPSYLAEVATIQKSYWEMSDELRLLKSYIPEHLLKEVLSRSKRGKSQQHQQPSVNDQLLGQRTQQCPEDFEMVERKNNNNGIVASLQQKVLATSKINSSPGGNMNDNNNTSRAVGEKAEDNAVLPLTASTLAIIANRRSSGGVMVKSPVTPQMNQVERLRSETTRRVVRRPVRTMEVVGSLI